MGPPASERARLILQSVTDNLLAAITYRQISRPAAEDPEIVKNFSNTRYSLAFVTTRNALILSSGLALMRIWDRNRGTGSISGL